MTKLSVNINKFATIRNARGGNNPDIVQVAKDVERFGGEGVTVHPRPDERHIRYDDVIALSEIVTTEFNIEGFPDRRYMDIIAKVKPAQATLVPDPPDAITSNAGWNTIEKKDYLKEIIDELKNNGVRTSIFIDPDKKMIEGAAVIGADRIELYTEGYASIYHNDKVNAIKNYVESAKLANEIGLGINAGHDLDLENLRYLIQRIPYLKEVSIGHALVCDALYFGLENTIQLYLREIKAAEQNKN